MYTVFEDKIVMIKPADISRLCNPFNLYWGDEVTAFVYYLGQWFQKCWYIDPPGVHSTLQGVHVREKIWGARDVNEDPQERNPFRQIVTKSLDGFT